MSGQRRETVKIALHAFLLAVGALLLSGTVALGEMGIDEKYERVLQHPESNQSIKA